MRILSIPRGTPLAEKAKAFSDLLRRAQAAAGDESVVKPIGGNRLRVSDDVADALESEPRKAARSTKKQTAAEPAVEPENNENEEES